MNKLKFDKKVNILFKDYKSFVKQGKKPAIYFKWFLSAVDVPTCLAYFFEGYINEKKHIFAPLLIPVLPHH